MRGETDAAGLVTFTAPASQYRLAKDVSSGDRAPIVACSLIVGDGALRYETAPEFIEVGGQNGAGIDIDLSAGTTWFCDWFSVADDIPGDRAGDKHKQAIVDTPCADGPVQEVICPAIGAGARDQSDAGMFSYSQKSAALEMHVIRFAA